MLNFGKKKISMENKLKRWGYAPKKYGVASQNEPAEDVYVDCNVRLYPDMILAYKKFAELFDLDLDQFILCNGGENAMKAALLALKPKDLTWFVPTWKMPEVLCAALDIKPVMKNFQYDQEKREIFTPRLTEDVKGDCFYSNYGNSSLFSYQGMYEPSLLGWNPSFKHTIIDLTYLDYKCMKNAVGNLLRGSPDNIIIGSFDKAIGCGLRLGFVIFNPKYNDAMQLQREQYINMCAYNWLLSVVETDFDIFYQKNPLRDKLEENLISFMNLPTDWTLNNNYFTVPYNVELNLNEVHFKIGEKDFTKFGIPQESDKDSLNKIYWMVKSLLDREYKNGNPKKN